jgi:hypothetical protein
VSEGGDAASIANTIFNNPIRFKMKVFSALNIVNKKDVKKFHFVLVK